MENSMLGEKLIAVIGLGYVGLPLAVEFGKIRSTIGYDIHQQRIEELQRGFDRTNELEERELQQARYLKVTSDPSELKRAQIYIVTVPTPIDEFNQPNFSPLEQASKLVATYLQKNDIVIYESTVYPGATEEVCVPILQEVSGLKFNEDFYCGYSPERINPGDKVYKLSNIVKVTSGSTEKVAREVDDLYRQIISAGTHLASSIKVAEAAKVIENTQRDINIALMNELSLIFKRMNIDTLEVLEAAGTKWNFLNFKPGLVGGHCIGVDPYYLTFKAQSLGIHPKVALAGRSTNDDVSGFICNSTIKMMLRKGINPVNAKVLILGIAFKENCPDIRNTKVADLVIRLQEFGIKVDIFDPLVRADEVQKEYCFDLLTEPEDNSYDVIILAVPHQEFLASTASGIRKFGRREHLFFDLKGAFDKNQSDWRL